MVTLDELGLRVDLRREPWLYPGPPLPFAALQAGEDLAPLSWRHGECLVESNSGDRVLLDHALSAHSVPAMSARTFVLGVGSNRSASTLLAKFGSAGASTVIPGVPVVVGGIGVGYSGHVSVPGFIAATPFRAPGGSLDGVISALDDEQLACLDATEPNYVRIRLDGKITDDPAGGFVGASAVCLYESRHGVLGDEWGEPVLFADQGEILRTLIRWRVLDESFLRGGIPSAVASLRRDPALREALRLAICARSLDSGLGDCLLAPGR